MGKFKRLKVNHLILDFLASYTLQIFHRSYSATDVGHYSNMLATSGQKIYRIFKLNIILYPDHFQDKGFSLVALYKQICIYIHYTAYFLDYER